MGLKRFPPERYAVVKDSKDPWAILVRSQDLHSFEFGPSLRAVGRAGAGVNNTVAALSKRGIPVFNAPGANANAVKELVLAGMLIAARNLAPALDFVQKQKPAPDLDKRIEEGKKQFAGFELPAHAGRHRSGKDWQPGRRRGDSPGHERAGLRPAHHRGGGVSPPSQVKRANSVDEVLKASHFVTLHVPLVEKTRHLVNAKNIEGFRTGAVLLNFYEGVVADEAVRKGTRSQAQVVRRFSRARTSPTPA